MVRIHKKVQGVPFIDSFALWASVRGTKPEDRLRVLMASGGVRFFDPKSHLFVREPAVGITGVGGLLIRFPETPQLIALSTSHKKGFSVIGLRKALVTAMGVGGFHTYLNPKDSSAEKLFSVMRGLGHLSTGHLVTLNFVVLGASVAVENEFNGQRDILHLARLTEARTSVQSLPSVVVLYPQFLPLFERVYKKTVAELRTTSPAMGKLARADYLEAQNTIFPSAKATAFMLTVSLRNLQKLVAVLEDPGKEEEYKRIVGKINDCAAALLPEMFPATKELGYAYPPHFLRRK